VFGKLFLFWLIDALLPLAVVWVEQGKKEYERPEGES
jgi:hypothetical protein